MSYEEHIVPFPLFNMFRVCALVAMVAATIASAVDSAQAQAPSPWLFFGGDALNTRGNISPPSHINQPTQINPRTVYNLALKWSYSTVGDVSATPTVEQGGLYVPDYAGYLYKLNPDTGALIWSHALADYLGQYGYSRGSPAIGAMGEIALGVNSAVGGATPGATLLSINRTTGAKQWQTVVDTNPNSYITSSPVIFNKRIYVGTTSSEESMPARIAGFVPTFRGSVVALDEATGEIVWRFYTVPPSYAGGAVWGSSPVAWFAGNALLVGTGNNYAIPAAATACQQSAASTNDAQLGCLDPTDYVDSLLSIDLTSGKLNWARRMNADNWNFACLVGPASACPAAHGLDIDFASAPNVVWLDNFVGVADDRRGASNHYFMGAGQKSGVYWGLNPYNGGEYWATFIGTGQIVWGSAINTDDRNAVYVALENHTHVPNVLAGVNGKPTTSTSGAWGSLSLYTGKFKWQIPTFGQDLNAHAYGGAATGPVTFTNRVVFAGSTSGYMVGIDANSGGIRWKFNAGGSIIGGASVYNETVYFGAGAVRSGPGSVHKVFAFAVPATQ